MRRRSSLNIAHGNGDRDPPNTGPDLALQTLRAEVEGH